MLKGLGDIGNIMKLQKEFKNIQKKITDAIVVGTSPDGKVHVEMGGDFRVKEVTIDPAYLAGADAREMAEAVRTAVNNAVAMVARISAEEMEKVTGGMNLGALGNLFK
ncbi:MAG: YbaB/EbfC family nucleoid-associated protein [Spirochaetes bacterium]|nr:YbaB/EbfC family nucleoid-associated protein [Spirochaetota bacterium]